MTKLNINVQEPYFGQIQNGLKTVEGRLAKEKFTSLKAGDSIIINNILQKQVKEVVVYSSFGEMLTIEGIKNVIPDAASLEQAIAVYHQFYSPEDEKKYGVCGVKFL